MAALVAATAAAFLLLPHLGGTPLVDWDEGIYAEVARGVHEGHALRLVWNGEAYDRKPPLLFWLIAASYDVFGVSEAAARLPSALAGVATVAVGAALVARRCGVAAGLLSAAFLLGSTLFLERGGRRACTDALLILFSTIALWRGTADPPTARSRVEAGIAIGFAILSKGAAGLVAPVALLLTSFCDRDRLRTALVAGGVGALVALPWYAVQVWLGGTSFISSHVGYELVARAVRPIHGNGAPWSYPLQMAWESGGAWVAVAALVATLRATLDVEVRRAVLPWLCAAALVLLAAMTMRTKLPWYPLPALPMLAIAGGLATARGRARGWSIERAGACAVLVLAAVASALSAGAARRTVLADELQFLPFRDLGARIASVLGDEPFIGVTQEHPTLVFYGRRPMRTYEPAELSRLLRDPANLPHAGLVPVDDATQLLVDGAEEIARFGDRVLLRFAPAPALAPVEGPQRGETPHGA